MLKEYLLVKYCWRMKMMVLQLNYEVAGLQIWECPSLHWASKYHSSIFLIVALFVKAPARKHKMKTVDNIIKLISKKYSSGAFFRVINSYCNQIRDSCKSSDNNLQLPLTCNFICCQKFFCPCLSSQLQCYQRNEGTETYNQHLIHLTVRSED